MSTKCRLPVAIILAFVFLFFYQWVMHSYALADQYSASASLWRSEAAMKDNFLYMLGAQVVYAIAFVWLYLIANPSGRFKEGLKFLLALGLLHASMAFATYSYMPITMKLALSWAAISFVKPIGLGFAVALAHCCCCKQCD